MNRTLWNDRFAGQVAVVTGAADGLGRAIAERLLAEGSTVCFLDRDENKLAAAAANHPKAHTLVADICNEAAIEQAFERVFNAHGRLDIAVNSAGIVGPNNKKVTDTPADGYAEVLKVNLFGSFVVCKQALRQMQKRNYGRVLLIASIAGKDGNAGMCAYSSAKAGVIGLAKSVGKEFAETGITINALAPAVVQTALVAGMEPAQVKYMTDRIPMKRCCTLEEVASMAAWIVSPEASFNTGFTFDLTGGRAVY
jgi:3-oxoacyl-[acyl-carrier protein] reductase